MRRKRPDSPASDELILSLGVSGRFRLIRFMLFQNKGLKYLDA